MAGRPSLRIGEHGRVNRRELKPGVWQADCRWRGPDGRTIRVVKQTPAGAADPRGRAAEDALLAELDRRAAAGGASGTEITGNTRLAALVDLHLERLADDGRSPATLATYRTAADKLDPFAGGLRVAEVTPHRLDGALRTMRKAHGPTMTRQALTIIKGALQIAVAAGAAPRNAARDVQLDRPEPARRAPALTVEELRGLLAAITADEAAQRLDLADPIAVLAGTGLRKSELLGLRWQDFDPDGRTIAVAGRVVRATGHGLQRLDNAKTRAGVRVVPAPRFVCDTLTKRRHRPFYGEQTAIFPSTAGGWRDPGNFGKQWRAVRDQLGVPDVSSHSFRRSVATLLDDAGFSPRVGADQLGHSRPSITMDVYQQRGRVHRGVADMLDSHISGE
ncbi:site-specific integrase [Mycolicibacter algericus]|uniref:Phage integrase n=2 Tax=Mycolicibacter algericus TaxID=1288388 RepID=A0A7I9Y7G0_MYCAL|nr:site-specific integrase [Mycolicibacter algericus]OQZ99077.1 site-specific integrase [Mycolicibacter algericus DSM 45454]GFG84562.1 phage integrase [Mycolicibacter algericus]